MAYKMNGHELPGPNQKKKKKKKDHIRFNKPKNKEAMDSFLAAQFETKGFDERETKRINP